MNSAFQPNTEGVFHGLPAAIYHAAPGVSHSMLRHMDPPARLPAYLAEPREPTDDMILGTLAHAFILEPEGELPYIVLRPETYPAPKDCSAVKAKKAQPSDPLPWHMGATYCKEWVRLREAEGKVIVTKDRWDSLIGMVTAIGKHTSAQTLLHGAATEVSLFKHFTLGGTCLRKARLDIVPNANVLADVKTTCDASPASFARDLVEKGYATQAAYYLDLWNSLNPGDLRDGFVFIVVERAPPYLVACYVVHPEAIKWARVKNMDRLSQYSLCWERDEWPGFATEFQSIDLPPWAYRKEVAA